MESKELFFYELEGRRYIFQNKKWDEAKHGFEDDMLNMAWEMWSSAKHSAKAQAVPEWNSVDDKEPPLGTMVLICWSDAPDVEPEKDYMDHDVDHGVNYWANYNDGDEPSHWMLLPKPVAQEQSHD